MRLNTRQQKVVNARESKILCLAPAASGKTRVLTERIRFLIEEEKVPSNEIVAMTFTNMAAEEMKQRLGDIVKDTFIGTIHAYANKICLMNQVDTVTDILEGKFDKIIEKALRIARFRYPKIKHVLVDECQDLSKLEFMFLSRLNAENVFFVGDDRQNIYAFKGGSDEFLRKMWHDESFKNYFLTENYRNAPNIIEYAEDFLDFFKPLSPHSIAAKTRLGHIYTDYSFYEAVDDLEMQGNWGTWFILTRTNEEIIQAQKILDERRIPNITFKRGDLESGELEEIMTTNQVKVLTVHQAKGLESPNVIAMGIRLYNEDERKIAYVAATRAENTLYWCNSIVKRTRKKTPPQKRNKLDEGVIMF